MNRGGKLGGGFGRGDTGGVLVAVNRGGKLGGALAGGTPGGC